MNRKRTRIALAAAVCLLACIVGSIAWAASKGKGEAGAEVDIQRFTWNWMNEQPANYYDQAGGVIDEALKGALADVEEVVFAVRANGRDWHWYANFGYNSRNANSYYYGGHGGKLCSLNLRSGQVRTIFEDLEGDVRDPAVHYDGKTILFAYRPGGTHQFHLYTIQADGTGLTQITDGAYDDFEPCWLPDGGIMFVSSRCMRWVPCWYSQVAIMYRCQADGSDLKPVSFGVENENTPWVMPDGRVLYTRWEYVDRGQSQYHGLWTIDPDGTGTMLFFDNSGRGMTLYIDAKPVPGTDKVVSIISPKHGRNEHRGRIGLISTSHGPDDEDAIGFLDRGYPDATADEKIRKKKAHLPENSWRDPYAVSDNCFLAATQRSIAVLDGQGDYELAYTLPESDNKDWRIHEPRPLRPRPREPVIPHVADPGDGMATMTLMDVTEGRGMEGVEKGTVTSLLVMEELPRPMSVCAYADVLSSGPNYVLHRVLGSVPVEPDGSAHFRVPAGRPLFFFAQDANGQTVKVMHSYVSAMPGEVIGCVGCHEPRTQSPRTFYGASAVAALRRPASEIAPERGMPQILDYVRDIQPIWDKHCISCHNDEQYAGQLNLKSDLGPCYSTSYTELKRVRRSEERRRYRLVDLKGGEDNAPYSSGSGGSLLMDVLLKGDHHGVTLEKNTIRRIQVWIDSGTFFAGSYGDIGSASRDLRMKIEDEKVAEALTRRCASCHGSRTRRGKTTFWIEGEMRKSSWYFNVPRPERSMLLLAPLARKAGGLEICKEKRNVDVHPPIFTTTDDPDYKVLLGLCERVSEEFGQPRWYQQNFQPKDYLVREMKRFGALDESYSPGSDVYRPWLTDLRYFQRIYEHGPGPNDAHDINPDVWRKQDE